MKTVNELIKDINSLTSHLHEKDFLLTWEQTPDELKQVLDVAAALKALRAENISTDYRFARQRIRLRYSPDMKEIFIVESDGTLTPIRLLKKTENALIKREKVHLCKGDE